MNLDRLTLAGRLTLAFAVVVLLGLAGSVFSVLKLGAIQDNLDRVVNTHTAKLQLTQDMSESVHVVARVVRTLALLDKAELRQAELPKIAAARTALS